MDEGLAEQRNDKEQTGTGDRKAVCSPPGSLRAKGLLGVPSPATHCRWPQRDPAQLRSGTAIPCTQKSITTVCICMFLNPDREKVTQTNSNTNRFLTGSLGSLQGSVSLGPQL